MKFRAECDLEPLKWRNQCTFVANSMCICNLRLQAEILFFTSCWDCSINIMGSFEGYLEVARSNFYFFSSLLLILVYFPVWNLIFLYYIIFVSYLPLSLITFFYTQVALKTLIVIHRALREVDHSFCQELINYSRGRSLILNLSHFRDDSTTIGTLYSLGSFTLMFQVRCTDHE